MFVEALHSLGKPVFKSTITLLPHVRAVTNAIISLGPNSVY